MTPKYRIEIAGEESVHELIALIIPTFAHFPTETLVGHFDTPEAIQASSQRHLRAWREHMHETGRPVGIKCMHTDPATGQERMVACAEWYIYDKPRSPDRMQDLNYLLTADWVSEDNGQQQKAKEMFKPVIEARIKWTAGRGHAVLMYVATDKAWRRQGAATACVEWGIKRCGELGIPAYLEASDEGAPVYEKVGFEKMEEIHCDIDGVDAVFPGMMCWPPGTKDEGKKPLA